MKLSGSTRILIGSAPIILLVATAGCATKNYVSKKIGVVDQRLNQLQAQGKQALEKQQREISQVNERVTTTDNHVAAVATTAEQANATAGQALQQTDTNASAISAHAAELVKLGDQFNYSLVGSGNVTFAFNKWELTNEAKAALDLIIQKAVATPRSRIEVFGYTDDVGSPSYNLTLSRRRAEAVARYLIQNNVQPMNISLIGLGEGQTPALLAAEVEAFNPSASKSEIRGLARRVRVKLYSPGASSTSEAASAASEAVQR